MIAKKDLNDLYQIFMLVQQYNLSGLPITEALNLYESKTPRPSVKKMLNGIRHDMENGIKMPDTFAKYPKFFPEYIVEMMRVNEGTGQAKDIYADIVKTLEQAIDLRRNLSSQMGTMIFLGIVLAITIGVVIFLVLPSMGRLMSDLQLDMPFYTKLLIGVGSFAQSYWWAILGFVAFCAFGIRFLAKKSPERTAMLIMQMPLYGPIVYNTVQYRFALVFGLCKSAGLDVIKTLQYTQKSVDNILMEHLIGKALKDLGRYGSSFVMALQKHNKQKVLDESFYVFLQAGEKGDMAAMMQLRADFYKKQLIVASQQFSQDLQNLILTPTFILLGLIVVSVLWPIFSMMSKISTGGMGGMGM